MVLLRTYDERSVVYHSQGRIGTYAIYWGHEAIQAGAFHALEDDDWIFPSYRESAIGLLRGMPPATVLSWWRGHPAGWWNPADYNLASICVPIATQVPHAVGLAWGMKLRKRLRGERPPLRADVLRRRCHLGGRVPRGRQLRGRHASAGGPALQQQPVGDLDAVVRADDEPKRSSTRLPATGSRGPASTAVTYSPSTRRHGRQSRVRAQVRAPRSSRPSPIAARPMRLQMTRGRTSISNESRRSVRTNASAGTRVTSGEPACSATSSSRRSRRRLPMRCARGSPPPRPSRLPTSD